MILHIVLLAIFVACLVSLVIMIIKILRSAKNLTPRQAIRMFEKMQEQRGTK
jgi:hypothetical protein